MRNSSLNFSLSLSLSEDEALAGILSGGKGGLDEEERGVCLGAVPEFPPFITSNAIITSADEK